jgi:hypothetical protein
MLYSMHVMLIGRMSIWEAFIVCSLSNDHLLVFIPLWILPSTFSGLAAGAFCIQFGVQGAWGVVRLNQLKCSSMHDILLL